MALVPDLVLYLEIDVDTLVPRVVRGKGMDYWESGMHLALSSDIFDSFQNYQRRIIEEYNRLARDFGFITIDARESINKIQAELRAHVSDYLRRAQSSVLPQSESASSPSSLQPAVQPRKA
jgi:dTMP kinase